MCPTFLATPVLQTDVQEPYCSYVCLKWEIKYSMNIKHHCDNVPTKYIEILNLQRETKRYLKPGISQVGLGTFLSILS